MRPQLILDLNHELIVDNFAGGGGTSTGIEWALGRSPDIAINHSRMALAMHEANHPQTLHLPEDIFEVDPVEVTQGRPVGLAWFSPDCKHFSKAKGGKPRSKKIRGLAWVMVKWAATVKPRVMVLENVEEFKTWGPILDDGTPCPRRKGRTFKSFIKRLVTLGYEVQWRELRACDYGAPTIRRRLFIIARCDGHPILWPQPTHYDPRSGNQKPETRNRKLPWRTAAECIDWSLPCYSIFLTKREAKKFRVKRPLAEATMRRIARGMFKFVLHAKHPFIVPLTHHGSDRVEAITEPMRTITAAHRGERAVVQPFLGTVSHGETSPNGARRRGKGVRSLQEPAPTLTASKDHALITPLGLCAANLVVNTTGHSGSAADAPAATLTTGKHHALVTGTLITAGYGEREGQEPRVPGLDEPARTIVAGGKKHALVSAFLKKHSIRKDELHESLTAVHLDRQFGQSTGADVAAPLGTITAGGQGKTALLTSQLAISNQQSPVSNQSASFMTKLYNTTTGQPMTEPLATVTSGGNHLAEVRAFLTKYYGNEKTASADLRDPMPTILTKDRLGIITVEGQDYQIDDIGMRMLKARELFLAQGFPPDYIITPLWNGKPLTEAAQVSLCGNSVPPPMAAAIIRANVPDMAVT